MDISRRRFIEGFFAAGAFGCSPALRAAGGALQGMSPGIAFGVVSDIHLAASRGKDGALSFAGEEKFRETLGLFGRRGVDAVAICGDMADRGLVPELEAVARAWNAAFPGGRNASGGKVERLFVYGNHDYEGWRYGGARSPARKIFGEGLEKQTIGADPAGAWEKVFGEAYEPVWKKEINGFTFAGAHWCSDKCRAGANFNPGAARWIEANAPRFDPARPFFWFQHPHPRNTCYGPWAWGYDSGATAAALSRFPNAVAFSGHSHASVNDERAIWQGAFTSIGAGSLKYVGLNYADVPPHGRENDRPWLGQDGEDPYKVMPRMPTRDGHQGMIVRVYRDFMSIERIDCGDFAPLGENWIVPLPVAQPPPFRFEKRAAESKAPQFAPGAALSVKMAQGKNRGGGKDHVKSVKQPVVEIAIPPPDARSGARALDFKIEIAGANGKTDVKYVFAQSFYRSAASGLADRPTVCRIAAGRLKAKGDLKIKVFPRNSFGKAGRPAEAALARRKPRSAG